MIGEGSVGPEFTTMFTMFINNKLDKIISPDTIMNHESEEYVLNTLKGIKYLIRNSYTIHRLYTPKLTVDVPKKRKIVKHMTSIQQTHLGLAFNFPFGFKDVKSSYIVWLLSRYLGGTMSSVIYIALREQAGIGYTVWADVVCKPDQSALTIYTSFEHKKLEKTMEIVLQRLNILHRQGMTAKDLKKLEVSNMKSIMMRMENPMFLADYYANHLLYGVDDKPYKPPKINNNEVNNMIKKYMNPDNILVAIITK